MHLYTGKISAVGEESDELIETIYDFIKKDADYEEIDVHGDVRLRHRFHFVW